MEKIASSQRMVLKASVANSIYSELPMCILTMIRTEKYEC